MIVKIAYCPCFEGNDGLPKLCKRHNWTYEETDERSGLCGGDAPTQVAYITGPKNYYEFNHILEKEHCNPFNMIDYRYEN